MTRSSRCSSLLFAASLWLLSAIMVSVVAAPADRVIPIAEARKLAPGTGVTIDGSVSTPSGAFESSFSDKGFGLQDRSAGIYISTPTNLTSRLALTASMMSRTQRAVQAHIQTLVDLAGKPRLVYLQTVGSSLQPRDW